MQGTWVHSLIREDPIGLVEQLSLCTKTTESLLWSLRAATTEACVPRAHARQQQKPLELEARALPGRVAPAHCN